MANKAFSQLPAAAALTGTEIIALTQSSASVRSTLAAVKTFFGVGSKLSTTIGDGTSASFTITHNFGTKEVFVEIYRNATPWDTVIADVSRPSDNTVTISGFGSAPSVNQYVVNIRS